MDIKYKVDVSGFIELETCPIVMTTNVTPSIADTTIKIPYMAIQPFSVNNYDITPIVCTLKTDNQGWLTAAKNLVEDMSEAMTTRMGYGACILMRRYELKLYDPITEKHLWNIYSASLTEFNVYEGNLGEEFTFTFKPFWIERMDVI